MSHVLAFTVPEIVVLSFVPAAFFIAYIVWSDRKPRE